MTSSAKGLDMARRAGGCGWQFGCQCLHPVVPGQENTRGQRRQPPWSLVIGLVINSSVMLPRSLARFCSAPRAGVALLLTLAALSGCGGGGSGAEPVTVPPDLTDAGSNTDA